MIPLCFVRCLHVLLAYGTGMFPAHAALMIMCKLLFGCCWTSCVGYTCKLCVVGTFYVRFECTKCLCASCVRVVPWLACTAWFFVSACNNGVFGEQILSVPPCILSCAASCLHALSALCVCFWELKIRVCFACDAKRVSLVISASLQGFPHTHTSSSSTLEHLSRNRMYHSKQVISLIKVYVAQ